MKIKVYMENFFKPEKFSLSSGNGELRLDSERCKHVKLEITSDQFEQNISVGRNIGCQNMVCRK